MLKISRDSEVNLINLMIDHNLIFAKDLINIRKISNNGTKSQIECIFELNLTNEDSIMSILVKEQDLEVVDLSEINASDELKNALPEEFIVDNFIVPFKSNDENLHIAISDSSKLNLIRNLKIISKKKLNYMLQKFLKFPL